jgi:hypothetical protein
MCQIFAAAAAATAAAAAAAAAVHKPFFICRGY